jgi:Protein of unknown function (DUF4235)
MKLAYKPLGLIVSALGGVLAGRVFKSAWKHVANDEDAPRATDKERGWLEVLGAAALEGAIFGFVKATVDRAGAKSFERATGVWPI